MSDSPVDWDQSYKEWLASGVTNAKVIETIQVEHPDYPTLSIVNGEQQETFPLHDKGGVDQDFLPARFVLQPVPVGMTTEQQTSIVISSLEGTIYQQVKNMTATEREKPMTVTPRAYLSNNKTVQLIKTPPVWNIHSITLSQAAVRSNLRTAPLRIHRIGRYYTALEFPVLRISR